MKKNYLIQNPIANLFRILVCAMVLLGLSATNLVAQTVAGYSFSQSTGTYTNISGGATALPGGQDDGVGTAQNIGFTFTYHGTAFTQFTASANGFICLGTTIADSYGALSSNANCISNLNGDGRTGAGGITYLVSGSNPNRVLTIQDNAHAIYYGILRLGCRLCGLPD